MTSSPLSQPTAEECLDLPPIPSMLLTPVGQRIETAGEQWRAHSSMDGGKSHLLNWSKLSTLSTETHTFSRRAQYLVKLYLADRLTRKSAGTVSSDYDAFLAFARWLVASGSAGFLSGRALTFDWSDFDEGIARAFLAHGVQHTASKGKHFSLLRAFYRWGVERQLADFSPLTLLTLASVTAGGNEKGHHVRFRDPFKGPFSPEERRAIKQALDAGKGAPRERALVLLHYELGLHPAAVTRLKNRDLTRYEVKATVFYHLDVPRVKKRTTQRETKRRPISTTLGVLLSSLVQGGPDAPLCHWLPPKTPEHAIYGAMRQFAQAAHLTSPTTNEQLRLSPRRFRYTLATQMAEEGASNLHIAEILDHTDLQQVGVYTETTSAISEPVARATDQALTPLVQRFLGKIVASAQAPDCEGLPNQHIPGATAHIPHIPLNVGGVGFCGRDVRKDGLCQLFPPLSCYLCPSFAAQRSGPHRTMLHSLEAYLQEHREQVDRRILLQLEELLAAIREVVVLIEL